MTARETEYQHSLSGIKSRPVIAWTIAGSDSGGGAGIQADLQSFHDFGVHGCTVITASTAQNSTQITDIQVTGKAHLLAQIAALDCDLPADAIKLGMLANVEILTLVSDYLQQYQGCVVCDPVLCSSNGRALLDGEAVQAYRRLLPRVDLLTPNIAEAELLSGRNITNRMQLQQAAQDLLVLGARSVIITGGHFDIDSCRCLDYWSDGAESCWLSGERIATPHHHGSGCSFAAAVTAAVAKGYALMDALVLAKAYVTQGIRQAEALGGGPGPVRHLGFPKRLEDFPSLYKKEISPARCFPDCGGSLSLYAVVDSLAWLRKLAALGVRTIQLRIKQPHTHLRVEIAEAVLLSRRQGIRLFINDYWQLAMEEGAYGVHLGQEDLDSADLDAIAKAGLRLGVSTHSYAEIARAHGIAPSYIAIGPIYPTTTKVMKFSAQGVAQLKEWVALLEHHYTLTAIGGIDLSSAAEVLATGVKSCAVVRAITQADDLAWTVKTFNQMHAHFDGGRGQS